MCICLEKIEEFSLKLVDHQRVQAPLSQGFKIGLTMKQETEDKIQPKDYYSGLVYPLISLKRGVLFV